MATRLICDTNIWYRLADGRNTMADVVKNPGESLWYTPFSVLELAGKLDADNWEQRKDAAQQIIQSNAQCLNFTETVMGRAFDYGGTDKKAKCEELCLQLANAIKFDPESDEITYKDGDEDKIVDIAPVRAWRNKVKQFYDEGILSFFAAIDILLADENGGNPGLESYHRLPSDQRTGITKPRLTKEQYDKFSKEVNDNSGKYLGIIFRSRFDLILRRLPASEPTPDNTDINRRLNMAYYLLICFCRVYLEYLLQITTQGRGGEGRKWETNDRIDVENFVYSTDVESIIVTGDKKWADLAKDAGFGDRVRHCPQNNARQK